MLGARRTAGEDGAQVLGARKGQTGDESLMFNYMLVLMALVMLVQLCVGDSGSPLADSSAYFVCVSSEGYRMGGTNGSFLAGNRSN